ncbi:MAG: signal peptide peptidase SppA [Planctomycetaceae bacterium]|jgi:protease-4|nr:signal peptide peptidase SppA [Planctomycetaceae bacterium]
MSDNIPPQVPPSVPPRFPQHPHPPVYHVQPSRSNGCGSFIVACLAGFVIFAVLGVGLLVGGFFLVTIAAQSAAKILDETEMTHKKVTEKFVSGNAGADNKVAILTINGVITGDEDGYIARQILAIQDDEDVKAVVLRVNSPGGTMSGSDYYLYLLQKMKRDRKIPVVVSMGGIAASGGYYLSMIGDEIYAEPSTITGSIGVIVSLFDGSELFKRIGVESTPITSGPLKAMGSFSKKMEDEERKIWQNLVDDSFARFKTVIFEGRKAKNLAKEEIDQLATGQIYTANEAVEKKLADKIGFLDDAVSRAMELAHLLERDTKTIRYKPKSSLIETLTESHSSGQMLNGKALSKISEMTVPQVYLLCPNTLPIRSEDD